MKYIILNTRQLWLWILSAILGGIAYSSFTADAVGIDHIIMGIGFAAFALLFLFGCFITPICTVFSGNGVTVVYLTGRIRRAKWQDVIDVSLTEDPGGRRPPYTHSYEVYPMEGKDGIFSDGRIPRSIGVRFFFHRYWKEEIDGEWSIAGVKARIRERLAKKEEPPKMHRKKRKKKR